jgi:hypothetical protein
MDRRLTRDEPNQPPRTDKPIGYQSFTGLLPIISNIKPIGGMILLNFGNS